MTHSMTKKRYLIEGSIVLMVAFLISLYFNSYINLYNKNPSDIFSYTLLFTVMYAPIRLLGIIIRDLWVLKERKDKNGI